MDYVFAHCICRVVHIESSKGRRLCEIELVVLFHTSLTLHSLHCTLTLFILSKILQNITQTWQHHCVQTKKKLNFRGQIRFMMYRLYRLFFFFKQRNKYDYSMCWTNSAVQNEYLSTRAYPLYSSNSPQVPHQQHILSLKVTPLHHLAKLN